MSRVKHGLFDSFLHEYAQNSAIGVAGAFAVATLLTGRASANKLVPLYAGIGGGIALNKCATNFNQLQDNEHRVLRDFQRAESREAVKKNEIEQFNQRLNNLRLDYFKR